MTDCIPKVTIVIPVYNGADFLSEAIDSALAQTYPNIEILLINDGSNDDGATERIILSYGKSIRYLKKSNGGVGSALNLAIQEMRGDYFSWLSHDDLYADTKLEQQVKIMLAQANQRTVVYSDYNVFRSSPSSPTAVELPKISPAQFRYWITLENALHGCTLLVPRSAFADCGAFNESLRTTQDYDLWFRMAETYSFVHVPEKLVFGRIHPGQDTAKMASLVKQECNALLTQFVDQLSPQDLVVGSGRRQPSAYALIFRSFHRRGFEEAARRARSNFIKSCFSLNPLDFSDGLRIVLGLVRSRALNIMKSAARRFSTYMFRQIPNALQNHLREEEVPSAGSVARLPLKEKFAQVYMNNLFQGEESRSGGGSDLVQTAVIRREIPRLLQSYSIRKILDAPCGDWYWMREVELGVEHYIGVDIVDQIIRQNCSTFGSSTTEFLCLDLSTAQLPRTDLILSRDCLVHLSYSDIFRILKNFKASGATYLLITTFTARTENNDLGTGFWRPLNFEVEPFNFPRPLKVINEGCTEGNHQYTDKSLALWRFEHIEIIESKFEQST